MSNDIFPSAKLMQLVEWGYPMGRLRAPIDPGKAFSVIHITAIPDATAEDEAAWRIRDTRLQNSATFFLNRNGSAVQCLGDPARMDPWANGDMRSPDTSNRRIADLVRSGLNANQRTLVAIENVGNEFAWKRANGTTVPGGFPITSAQEATCARIIAHYHGKAGVPINRETVIGHYQLNSVTRANCPARDKAVIDRIIAAALRPSEDEMNWVSHIKPLTPYIATLDINARTRTEPTTKSRGSALIDVAGREIVVIGEVQGEEYAGSTRWLAYLSSTWGIGVTHEINQISQRPLGTDTGTVQKQIDTALARVAAVTKAIPSLRASNENERVAIEALAKVVGG